MSLLSQFEKETNISVKTMTENDLINIMSDSRYEHFFKYHSQAVELIDEMIQVTQDNNFKKELFTVRHTFNLTVVASLLEKLFDNRKEEKITDEEFRKKLYQNFESDDPLYVISTLACLLLSKYELNVTEYFESFKENISKIKNIFDELGRVENSYRYRVEILDFLYTAQQEFFFKYEKDLLEDAAWIDNEIDIINEFENNFNPEIFEEVDIFPEELGLIDITKLPKE